MTSDNSDDETVLCEAPTSAAHRTVLAIAVARFMTARLTAGPPTLKRER